VHVTIESGTTFTSATPYVLIRDFSSITNAADLSVSTNNSSIFNVVGGNNTIVNTGTLTVNAPASAIDVFGGANNIIRNDGFIRADNLNGTGIFVRTADNITIINNGEITSNPLVGAGTAIRITNGSGLSSLTINNGLLASAAGTAFRGSAGNERLENFGQIYGVAGSAAATLDNGNDTYVIGGNSFVSTYIDGGEGSGDTLAFGDDTGTLDVSRIGAAGTYRSFEIIEKFGTADWTLTGNNTDTLLINVTGGLLTMNATMTSSLASVGNGATLSGTGAAGGLMVASGGTFAPGGRTAIGTFTSGATTFADGSIFRVRVNDQGGSDRVQVNGVATINGGRVFVDASQGYALNNPYRILTATSITGPRFQSAVASLALLQAVLSYDATNVYVTLERTTQPPDEPNEPDNPDDPADPDTPDNPITLDEVGRTWNQISTGRALESQGIAGPLLPVVLAQPTIPAVLRALDLLSGEAYATAVGIAAGDTEAIHQKLLARLRTAGAGAAPTTAPLAYAPPVGKAPFPAAPRSPALLVDLWGQGFGTWGSRDGRDSLGLASIGRNTGGFILGAETSFDSAWRIGMAGAYTQTSFDLAERLSSGSIDSYHAALYGSGALGRFALRGGATYTRHELDVNRSAVLTGFSDEAHGSLSLDSAGLFAEIGYPLHFGRLTAEPIANLSYVHTGSGSFAEDGGAMALRGRTNGFDTAWTTLGVRLSGDLTGDGSLKANAMLGWRHAFGDRLPMTVNRFAAGGDPFLIVGNPDDRDSLVIETGLDWHVTSAMTLGVRYDGQYGAQDRRQSVLGHFTARF
jgi:outer membrane autotransporter protein